MARRIDYLNDPNAPKANSIVPSVNIAVRDDTGRLLLICRSDNGNWALPGGAVDVGERLTEAGVRETLEETGIRCALTGLVGIYTDPGHVIHYTSNNEVRQEFSIVLAARAVAGAPTPSSESTHVRWVAPDQIDHYRIHPSMRLRITHALEDRTTPYLG
ncbi:MAG: NUDIX domain-containing protein [Thermobifida fusca]|nr:NUDIX domain-containing protein [Thermobifida fusca]